jgi:hypothetical protein
MLKVINYVIAGNVAAQVSFAGFGFLWAMYVGFIMLLLGAFTISLTEQE